MPQSRPNNIGHLILLYGDENDSFNNGSFRKKKDVYKDNDLNITKAIVGNYKNNSKSGKNYDRVEKLTKDYELSYANENEWNKDLIKKRGRKLLVDFTNGKLDD